MERKTTKKSGVRVDAALKERYASLTGTHIDEAIEQGWVRDSAGRRVRKGDRVSSPADLQTTELDRILETLRAGTAELSVEIVADSPDFWVVDKPAGLPGHPLKLVDRLTVTHWAFHQAPELAREFPETQPTLSPHRLDNGTSGLLVVAKTRAAYDRWRDHFHSKRIEKTYFAWCWGGMKPESSIEMTWPIAWASGDRTRRVAVRDGVHHQPPVNPAHTEARFLQAGPFEGLFLAEVLCRTGVTHQVRVHMAAAGFPLAGDTRYDPKAAARPWRPKRHQLRAMKISSPEGVFEASGESFRTAPFA